MSIRRMRLEVLDGISDERVYGYAYDPDDEEGGGSLVLRDDYYGDTALPPYQGRWRVLEEADSAEHAEDLARTWEEEFS